MTLYKILFVNTKYMNKATIHFLHTYDWDTPIIALQNECPKKIGRLNLSIADEYEFMIVMLHFKQNVLN